MEKSNQTALEKVNDWVKNSITLKIIVIGLLILVLLIPMNMIRSLIFEREQLSAETIREVSEIWGASQTLAGPILTIPYKVPFKTDDGVAYQSNYVHILPDQLAINGQVAPETRYRGIYEVAVYQSALHFSGTFPAASLKEINEPEEYIMWEEAFVTVGIPDMRGIIEDVALNWEGEQIQMNPGLLSKDIVNSGIVAKTPLNPEALEENMEFSFSLHLNGSRNLSFIPLGRETKVKLTSSWPDPGFSGAFIPRDPEINEDGFTAEWKTLNLNRNFPQIWKNSDHNVNEAAFGVNLVIPVDEYQKSMRSAKYGVLVIALTFLIFFFVEVLNKKCIHPFQYILVGLALTLFYSLLVSLSEQIGFNAAFMVSAGATAALVAAYSQSIYKNRKLTSLTGLFLAAIYGFIFVIIQLTDLALLAGSLGLFVILALVMYLSRNVDWYGVGSRKKAQELTQ